MNERKQTILYMHSLTKFILYAANPQVSLHVPVIMLLLLLIVSFFACLDFKMKQKQMITVLKKVYLN